MASVDEAKQIIKDTPITSVINYYISLNKKGANYEAICPFHADTHPSLKVSDSKGLYKCFVCGVAGDAIHFVKNFKRFEYIDAIKDIAHNLGITVELTERKKLNPKFELGFKVLNASTKLYKKIATEKKPPEFSNFISKRKINEKSLLDFKLGFAPGNNALLSYLSTLSPEVKDGALKLAREIGILNQSERGMYDFFRDRIMFPIFDNSGQVRGFSSRAIRDGQVPKYLNSKESFMFDKGSILYGFHLARNDIRQKDRVILVEGNMDVLMLHQFDFRESVGTMGVALSERSAKLLSNMTKNIYMGLDSDDAGMKAMEKIHQEFLSLGIMPKILDFSPAKDPDEFLKEYGRLKLQEKIENAPLFIDFIVDRHLEKEMPSTTDHKLSALNLFFSWLAPLKEDLRARELLIIYSKKLGLHSSSDDISKAYEKYLEGNKNNLHHQQAPLKEEEELYIEEDIAEQNTQSSNEFTKSIPKAELILLEKLIAHPEMLTHPQISEILDLVYHFEVKRLIQWLVDIYLEIDDQDYIGVVLKEVNTGNYSKEVTNIIGLSLYDHTPLKLNDKVVDKLIKDIILKLNESHLKHKRDKLKEKQKLAKSEDEVSLILMEIQKVQYELNELKKR